MWKKTKNPRFPLKVCRNIHLGLKCPYTSYKHCNPSQNWNQMHFSPPIENYTCFFLLLNDFKHVILIQLWISHFLSFTTTQKSLYALNQKLEMVANKNKQQIFFSSCAAAVKCRWVINGSSPARNSPALAGSGDGPLSPYNEMYVVLWIDKRMPGFTRQNVSVLGDHSIVCSLKFNAGRMLLYCNTGGYSVDLNSDLSKYWQYHQNKAMIMKFSSYQACEMLVCICLQ